MDLHPPNFYVVTEVLDGSEAPKEVRELSSSAVTDLSGDSADVAWVARIHDPTLAVRPRYPEWFVALGAAPPPPPPPLPGQHVRGSGGSSSTAESQRFENGQCHTVLRVHVHAHAEEAP
jgi:hypothetical protein